MPKAKSMAVLQLHAEGRQLVWDKAHALLGQMGNQEPPFSPELLAPLRGIKRIIPTLLGKIDAVLIPEGTGYIIKVNANHSAERQRFSCSHEIVHTFFLDQEGVSFAEAAKSAIGVREWHNLEERLCHLGASELLMPYHTFKKYFEQQMFHIKHSISSIEPLSKLFQTSIQATAIRVKNVQTRSCELILWQQYGKVDLLATQPCTPEVTGLRYRQSFGKSSFIRFKRPVTPDSYIEKALNSEGPTFNEQSHSIGKISRFCRIESQAFGYGRNRYVVSLIFPQG